MGQYFNSKLFNPEAFAKYVNTIPNVRRDELAKSGAIGFNALARAALATQTGSLFATVPYYGRISGTTSQNNDGATDIISSKLSTFEQGFVTASRMDSWTEISFSKNITSGVNFMDEVGKQIATYKEEVRQTMILAMLKGIFSMSTSGNTVRARAAKEFVEKHTYDASNVSGVAPEALNSAIQKACGDNKSIFKLVIMHSSVATNLENQKLLKFMTYTDANGITRDLGLATWNGRLVLIDDNMPTEEVAASGDDPAYTKYTSYVLGEGSIILDSIGDANPYEMNRDPRTNGGEDTLYVRDRYICGFDGLSFVKPVSITASASNSDLEDGDNWAIINNGTEAISTKSIAIARLITRG